MSSGYKNYIADKGLNDETYTSDGVALIRISGTSTHNNKALQVEAVCSPTCLVYIYFSLAIFYQSLHALSQVTY